MLNIQWNSLAMYRWGIGTQLPLKTIAARGMIQDVRGFATGAQRMMVPTVSVQGFGMGTGSDQNIVVDQVLRDVGSCSRMELERDLPMLNPELDASLISIKKIPLLMTPIPCGQTKLKLDTIKFKG